MTLDVDRFRSELETERARLASAIDTVNHKGSLDEETGDLSSGPGDHLGDHGTDTFMRELDNGLEENAEHLIQEIDAALERIANGTYGTCAACGRPIAEERLDALPYAKLCIDDARRLAS